MDHLGGTLVVPALVGVFVGSNGWNIGYLLLASTFYTENAVTDGKAENAVRQLGCPAIRLPSHLHGALQVPKSVPGRRRSFESAPDAQCLKM
jgi:hypothetical protein